MVAVACSLAVLLLFLNFLALGAAAVTELADDVEALAVDVDDEPVVDSERCTELSTPPPLDVTTGDTLFFRSARQTAVEVLSGRVN